MNILREILPDVNAYFCLKHNKLLQKVPFEILANKIHTNIRIQIECKSSIDNGRSPRVCPPSTPNFSPICFAHFVEATPRSFALFSHCSWAILLTYWRLSGHLGSLSRVIWFQYCSLLFLFYRDVESIYFVCTFPLTKFFFDCPIVDQSHFHQNHNGQDADSYPNDIAFEQISIRRQHLDCLEEEHKVNQSHASLVQQIENESDLIEEEFAKEDDKKHGYKVAAEQKGKFMGGS